ncbi:MAG: hypothetical protein ACHP85_25590, partial [Burkholderiales bacterium]
MKPPRTSSTDATSPSRPTASHQCRDRKWKEGLSGTWVPPHTSTRLWEARRLETQWDVIELASASPGAFLQVEAVFENGRAA